MQEYIDKKFPDMDKKIQLLISSGSREISSKDTSININNSDHKPSMRSRKSVIQGSSMFVWDREKITPTQPYYHHKYELPYNLPPNEVNFMGGLGQKIGNPRSKIHPNRSTMVQKLLSMRTSNRILKSFGEPLENVHCMVREKKAISTTHKCMDEIAEAINRIKIADNFDTPSASEISSSDEIPIDTTKIKTYDKPSEKSKNNVARDDHVGDEQTDYVYYYDKYEIKSMAKHFMENELRRMNLIYKFENEEQSFGDWARGMRKKYKEKLEKTDNDESVNYVRRKQEDSDFIRKQSIIVGSNAPRNGYYSDTESRQSIKKNKRIKKLGGYLYGPFSKIPSPDPFTKDKTKFNIPLTMIRRYEAERKKKKIQKRILRRARLSHMKLPMPPSGEYSSDESVENVKTLTLLRTPYFIIPKVKTQQKRKADRFRNEFLHRAGLRRITMLLYDRTVQIQKTENRIEEDLEKHKMQNRKTLRAIASKVRRALAFRITPVREKYYRFIEDQYSKQQQLYYDQLQAAKGHRMTFEEFKENEITQDDATNVKSSKQTNENETNNFKGKQIATKTTVSKTDTATTKHIQFKSDKFSEEKRKNLKILKPKLMFRKPKISRATTTTKTDDLIGPFYTDPELMDKFRSPWKFKQESKYYTSLIRGRNGIRNRLQVNANEFEDEKLGVKQKFFHRLSTEWDNYYIHELRYRPPVKKFCFKTDTILFREITRKKFIMFYVRENLLSLIRKQNIEQHFLDEFDKFVQDCLNLFRNQKYEYNERAMNTIADLVPLQARTQQLECEKQQLQSDLHKTTENILNCHHRLELCIKMQTYYFLLMNINWRNQHDFIFRKADGMLRTPFEIFKMNPVANDDFEFDPFVYKTYYETNIVPNLDKINPVPPDPVLFKRGLNCLKTRSFTYLLHHNKTLWYYQLLKQTYDRVFENIDAFFNNKQKLIEFQQKKLDFVEERNYLLHYEVKQIMKKPLEKSIKNPTIRRLAAICHEIYLDIVPKEKFDDKKVLESITVIEKFTTIQETIMFDCVPEIGFEFESSVLSWTTDGRTVLSAQYGIVLFKNLLEQLDKMPMYIVKASEAHVRSNRKKAFVDARKAVVKQNRFNILKKQLKFHFNLNKVHVTTKP